MRRSVSILIGFLAAGLLYALAVTWLGQVSGAYFDSVQYLHYGRNLLSTGVYGTQPGVPDMNREPGYGMFLAGLMAIVGDDTFRLKACQAFMLFLSAALAAFAGGLPHRLRRTFFLLAVLSPSCIGAVREIYSEALAIPLSLLLLGAVSRAFQKESRIACMLAGLVFGLAVLTKSYLYYACFLFLLLLFGALAFRARLHAWKLIAGLCFCLFFGGFGAQQGWNARNRAALGENVSEQRLSIALAGKVARLHEASWPRELPAAVAGSLGTNLCDGLFGQERCARFDYRGCDQIGLEYKDRYLAEYKVSSLADQALKRDMIHLWLNRPFTQLFGSGLELLRMFFFEAFLDAGTLPALLRGPARAWHLLGSILFWGLILVSFTRQRRHWTRLPGHERVLTVFCIVLLAYHATTMSQITNVVRYIFPVLPFLYYFTADGIAVLSERRKAWTVRLEKKQ